MERAPAWGNQALYEGNEKSWSVSVWSIASYTWSGGSSWTKVKILLKALYEEEDDEKIIAVLFICEDVVINYFYQKVAF